MPIPNRKARVVLAQPARTQNSSLVDVIRQSEDFELFHITDTMEAIWRGIIARSPEVAVLFFPVIFGTEEERCVNVILRGSHTSVILVIPDGINSDEMFQSEKLIIFKVTTGLLANQRLLSDGIISRINNLLGKKSEEREETASVLQGRGKSGYIPLSVMSGHLVAIGASTGGTEALAKLFRLLPDQMPGIVVVQHMPPVFTKMYADRLNNELPFEVDEATDNNIIKPNTIHIAPGDRQMTVKKRGSQFYTSLGNTEKVSGHCPSVDVLFESVAESMGRNSTGVILTGMGADGALGMLSMRKHGAYTFGQNEASCVVYGMPKKALENGAVAKEADLQDIPRLLVQHLSQL